MTASEIFEPVSAPHWHRRNPLGGTAPWLTWSAQFRDFVVRLHAMGVLKRRAFVTRIRGCEPYAASYSLSLDVLPGDLRTELLQFAARLPPCSDRNDLRFFRDMLAPPFDQGRMRAVFSLLRTAVATVAGDDRAAIYSPVPPERKDAGFKLHADLFLTTRVWLVFDDVPDDGTGASLFLSRRDLLQTMRSNRAVPEKTARDVAALMTKPVARDSFERLYQLIHSERNRWHDSLHRSLHDSVKAISLRRGEGYLMDDRRWLHGRTAASSAITSKRFHRLSYGIQP